MSTAETLKSIAQRLGLNYKSLGGYMRRNYPELLRNRSQQTDKP